MWRNGTTNKRNPRPVEKAEWAANEADLKLPALDAFVTSLNLLNKNEGTIYKKAQNARAARNKALFDPKIGVVVLGNRTRNYIKSAFGPASSQYAMVKHLIFEDITKR